MQEAEVYCSFLIMALSLFLLRLFPRNFLHLSWEPLLTPRDSLWLHLSWPHAMPPVWAYHSGVVVQALTRRSEWTWIHPRGIYPSWERKGILGLVVDVGPSRGTNSSVAKSVVSCGEASCFTYWPIKLGTYIAPQKILIWGRVTQSKSLLKW